MTNYIFENKHYKTLNIFSLGHEKCKPNHCYEYAYAGHYIIHYVSDGCGRIISNGVTQRVKKGEMFIIKPTGSCKYTADSETPWTYTWIKFDGEISDVFNSLPDVVKYSGNIFNEMREVINIETTRTEFLTAKLYELVSELFENSGSVTDYVKMAEDYVKANYMHRLYVKEISDTLNLNRNYFSRIFKSKKGISIQDYIINYKIKRAKFLLSKDFKVAEVSRMVGYEDAFAFSKIFKKRTGLSPQQYIKS